MSLKVEEIQTLDEVNWTQRLKGWLIVGCTLRKGGILGLALRKDIPDDELARLWDSQVPTRVFSFNLANGRNGFYEFETGMPFPKIGSSEVPDNLMLCAAREATGPVFVANRDYAEMEQIAPEGAHQASKSFTVKRIVQINGSAYAIGLFRDVFKRIGKASWERIDSGLSELTQKQISATALGFLDLHGLTEDNMYAVGGHGDVWRYDGTRWIQCDFPSNKQLDTVTVAPDGQVYISGQSGSLWVGREDTWTLLYSGGSSVPYNDSRWFNDRLWLISDYQFHIWEEGELRRPTYNGVKLVHAGYMDCLDDLMLVASNNGTVHISDGTDWKTVIRPYS